MIADARKNPELKQAYLKKPEKIKGDNRNAMRIILGIIVAALLAVVLGHRRKRLS